MKYLGSMRLENPEAWLEAALECRKDNVDVLKGIESNLKGVYRCYDKLVENFEEKPGVNDFSGHKGLLVNYYEHPPAQLKQLLIARRTNHGLLDCPFCGSPNEPDTLDHFVPKDDWPEFSINPNNLVPQCRGCAPTKSSKYYCDEVEAAIFLHPMYADFLSRFRFKIKVEFSESTKRATFELRLSKPESMSAISTERVVRHFKRLKLQKRVQLYCYRELKKWKSLLNENCFNIESALKHRLDERPNQDHGKDWKTALYIGILENRTLVDYLGSLPNCGLDELYDEVEVEVEL